MNAAPKRVRIIALGNPDRGDDGAALNVAARIQERIQAGDGLDGPGDPEPAWEVPEVILAGRPGASLLDLLSLDRYCLLLDATISGAPPGTLHELPLDALAPERFRHFSLTSHGFGAGEALALAFLLGRAFPQGIFLGIEGRLFGVGDGFSDGVRDALPLMEARVLSVLLNPP